MEDGISDAETAFFNGGLCLEPRLMSDRDLDDSAEAVFEGGLQFVGTECGA